MRNRIYRYKCVSDLVCRISILPLLILLFALSSCAEDDLGKKEQEVVSGLPTIVTLSVETPFSAEVQTRAGEPAQNDSRVSNLWILLFDSETNTLVTKANVIPENNSQKITFEAKSGKYYIYAVANSHDNNTYENVHGSIEALKEGASLESVKNFLAIMTQPTLNYPDGLFLMSGHYTDGDSAEECVLNVGNATLHGSIKLKRLAASISFNIGSKEGIVFTPSTWKVVNVPKTSFLFEGNADADSEYYETEAYNFSATSTGVFTVYLQENRKLAKQTVYSSDDREDEAFAPDKSTYVVLTGHYKGPGTNKKEENGASQVDVDADVTYYIHFGNTNNQQAGSLSDYNTLRNNKYTYNVVVNGVEDIITEVVTDDPYHPADGDVIYSGTGAIVNVDAHYGCVAFNFNKSKLGEKDVQFSAIVKSPKTGFTPVVYELDATNNQPLSDWNWIKFRLNGTCQDRYVTTANPVYPGTANVLSNIETWDEQSVTDLIRKLEQGEMITVKNLLHLLKYCKDLEDKLFKKGEVIFTGYIDEYYYADADWKTVVNTNDREMSIICDVVSNNGSSLTYPTYLVRQKSIQTVYDFTKSDLNYAWGLEWYEAPEKPGAKTYMNYYSATNTSLPSGVKNMNDGRMNMLDEKNYTAWNNESNNGLNPTFDYAYANCMKRNRDEDGNGTISDDEIKWYLPAMNQLQDYWLGVDAIASGAKLFNQNKFEKAHFFSNSGNHDAYATTGLAKQRIFWAEEGSSTSHLKQYDEVGDGGYYQARVRCVRNLGTTAAVFAANGSNDSSSGSAVIPDLVSVSRPEGNTRITMNYLNEGSMRKSYVENNELGFHLETEENNRPYKALEFYKSIISIGDWITVKEKAEDNNSKRRPCASIGTGWRVPNQREYVLYATRTKDFSGSMVTRTGFSFGKYGPYSNIGNRYGYVLSAGSMGLSQSGKDGTHVRCVKDIQ